MTIKTYWTIVYRPMGSGTWTQWFGYHDELTPRWTTEESAKQAVLELNSLDERLCKGNADKTPLQFREAKVEVEE